MKSAFQILFHYRIYLIRIVQTESPFIHIVYQCPAPAAPEGVTKMLPSIGLNWPSEQPGLVSSASSIPLLAWNKQKSYYLFLSLFITLLF